MLVVVMIYFVYYWCDVSCWGNRRSTWKWIQLFVVPMFVIVTVTNTGPPLYAVRSVRRCLCNWRLCPQTVSVLEPCDARRDLNVSRTSAKRMAGRNK